MEMAKVAATAKAFWILQIQNCRYCTCWILLRGEALATSFEGGGAPCLLWRGREILRLCPSLALAIDDFHGSFRQALHQLLRCVHLHTIATTFGARQEFDS